MSRQPSHIPLAGRKVLCGRTVFFEASHPHALALIQEAPAAFDKLRHAVADTTNLALQVPRNDQPLDEFLHGQLIAVLETAARGVTDSCEKLASKLFGDVRRFANAISCQDCAGSLEHVCCGSDTDSEVVSAGGQCVASFRLMFKWALAEATKCYEKYGTKVPQCGLPEVTFSTDFVRVGKPHDIPVDYFVGGVTDYFDSEDRASSEVKVVFRIEKFDWETYLAILYVLVHECVCHAFQGISPTYEGRKQTLPNDSFCEGWMDWVSHELMGRALTSDTTKSAGLLFPARYRDAGNEFHRARFLYDREVRAEYSTWWAEGKLAAENLQLMLNRGPFSNIDPLNIMLRLSVDLNMLQLKIGVSEFVSRLAYQLPQQGQVARPGQLSFAADFLEVLRNYIGDNDLYSLIRNTNII